MSMSVPALATNNTKTFEKQGVPNATMKKVKKNLSSGFKTKDFTTSAYITIYNPIHHSVFYKGEKIYSEVQFNDVWEDAYTNPSACIFDSNENIRYSLDTSAVIPTNGYSVYTSSIPTHFLSPGKYSFAAFGFPSNQYGEHLPEAGDVGEMAEVDFYIRVLKAPTSVKAKATKKKVTVSFASATGAKKYEIYRSTKKTSGFKKIKTTTSRKYVDRKVKRGKRYYYKVKSIRTGKGTIKSVYSKVVRSNKVK